MRRTVILVDGTWTRNKDPRIPLGHGSILTTLKEISTVEVHSIVEGVNTPNSYERVIEAIDRILEGKESNQVNIACGVYVWSEDWMQSILQTLRERGFSGRIILGGPQISNGEEGLEKLYPEADVFIRGYGEMALTRLVQSSKKQDITGVHWAGEIDKNQQAMVNLEQLLSPWLNNEISLQNQPFIRWETQRGCPFACNFCQHKEPGARLKYRTLCLLNIHEIVCFWL